MKKLLNKIFKPNKVFGILLCIFSVVLLVYVFANHLDYTPIAYVTYTLSFYALIVFSIWFYKACEFSNNFVKENSRLYKFYQKNIKTITTYTLIFSSIFNLLYGVLKLGFGVFYKSEWFITFAVYYLLLCFMKFHLFRNFKDNNNLITGYKSLKNTGIVLFLLNFVLTGMIILIISQNQVITYPGYLIFIVAMYDFYLIITAFINVFKYRKEKNPILIATKCISLTVAMISMVSLEVAMIYQFGTNETTFKIIMTGSMGFAVCLINSIMAIFMIVKAKQNLKSKE